MRILSFTNFYSISRASLYNDEEPESENEQLYMPSLEFDFIEVDQESPEKEQEEEQQAPDDEYAFRLFAKSSSEEIQKFTLKEEEEEIIVNERPTSYYIAVYADKEKEQFFEAAITSLIIFDMNFQVESGKVMSIEEHNEQIEVEQKKKRRRAGKKQRLSKALCREKKHQREKDIARLRRENNRARKLMFKQEKERKRLKVPVTLGIA